MTTDTFAIITAILAVGFSIYVHFATKTKGTSH